jgi:hypothetical protein
MNFTRRQLLKLTGATLAHPALVALSTSAAVAHPPTPKKPCRPAALPASKQTKPMPTPTGSLFQNPIVKPLSPNGLFMSGCTATFYLTGTTTPATIYSDGLLTTPLANPLSCDASGTFQAVYLDPAVIYRIIIKDKTGITISDTDPVVPSEISALTSKMLGKVQYPQTAAELANSITPSNFNFPTGNVRRYGALGDGLTDDTPAWTQALTIATTGALGYVYASGGTYSVGALTATIPNVSTDPTLGTNLNIYGDGINLTVLKQKGSPSGQLLNITASNPAASLGGCQILIENLSLQGVGNTCHGISLRSTPNWELRSVYISGFNRGLNLQSSLLGCITGRSFIFSNHVGVYATSAGGAAVTAPSPANLISVRDARINANSQYGCDLVNGSGIRFDGVDFEGNGSTATCTSNPASGATTATLTTAWPLPSGAYACTFPDGEARSITFTKGSTTINWTGGLSATQTAAYIITPTGAIVLRATLSTGFGAAQVSFDDCWFEGNHGQCLIGENVPGLNLSFKDTLILGNDNGLDLNIGGAQHVLVDSSFMQTAAGSTSVIGASVSYFTARNTYFGTLNDTSSRPVYENVLANGATSTWGRHTQWTASLTGCTTVPTQTVDAYQQGDEIRMDFFTALTATSNTTGATITGVPNSLNPPFTRGAVAAVYDNAVPTPMYCTVGGNVITLGVGHVFTASGAKGVPVGRLQYRLGA